MLMPWFCQASSLASFLALSATPSDFPLDTPSTSEFSRALRYISQHVTNRSCFPCNQAAVYATQRVFLWPPYICLCRKLQNHYRPSLLSIGLVESFFLPGPSGLSSTSPLFEVVEVYLVRVFFALCLSLQSSGESEVEEAFPEYLEFRAMFADWLQSSTRKEVAQGVASDVAKKGAFSVPFLLDCVQGPISNSLDHNRSPTLNALAASFQLVGQLFSWEAGETYKVPNEPISSFKTMRTCEVPEPSGDAQNFSHACESVCPLAIRSPKPYEHVRFRSSPAMLINFRKLANCPSLGHSISGVVAVASVLSRLVAVTNSCVPIASPKSVVSQSLP